MLPGDPLNRVLYIDLNNLSFNVEERSDLFNESLGGTGVGIKLLMEECPAGIDPTHPRNPIIFTVGPLVGHYPLASKTVAMFKSPHSGDLGESHAGGRSAISIRLAGYGAIVIRGSAKLPLYLSIDDDGVQFHDASALWGMRSSYTVGSVLRSREKGSGLRSIMRIGRAGERGVSYACVTTETYRHFGRLGLGALFGAKKIKALVIGGKRELPVSDRRAYRNIHDKIFEAATQTELMKKYHELGTSMNVLPLNMLGALPTRNLQSGRFESAESISGEHLAKNYLGRRVACAHCPVACIHLAALRIPYPKDPFFYKTLMLGYDHELIYAVGSMLGIGDVTGMLRLIDESEIQGVDVMSTGVGLAWATEAFENGMISTNDTDDLELAWGEANVYIEAVKRIVTQPTDFFKVLARGVEHAASVYGGADFALAFNRNEMPGYHTGPGSHLGYLTGARHSHLDSAGYSLDQKAVATDIQLTAHSLAEALIKEERWRQVLTSLPICLFARGLYTPEIVQQALATVGFDLSLDDLNELGAQTLREKHAFKDQEGFRFNELRIPKRIFETLSPTGPFNEQLIREAIDIYAKSL